MARLLAGRYRLVEPLGRGGMAVVWRATDEVLGREVAVKILELTGTDREQAAARFRREARATAALNAPNIVTVFDTGVEGTTAYLVMELLPGPTLAEQVRDDGPLAVPTVRRVAGQLCAALTAAHRAGIVHRDIKPGNIAYAADGTVKVLDFGITALMDEPAGAALTRTNTVVGTAEYLAPEQATGGRVDGRADLYALGCVLFYLLTGRPPFTAPTAVALMMKQVNDPAPDIRDTDPALPADLAGAIRWLLAKDPADRPTDAAEVAPVLAGRTPLPATAVLPATGPATTEVLTSTPVRVGPVTGRGPSHPARWVLVLLLVAALVAGAVALVSSLTGDRTGGSTPTTSAPVSTGTSRAPTSTTTTTRSTSSPASTTRTTSPTSTTRTTTPTSDPVAALADLRAAAASAHDAGGIDDRAYGDIGDQLDQVGDALGESGRKAQKAVDDLDGLIKKLTKDGQVTEEGAAALIDPFTALRSAVDAMPTGKAD